MVRAKVLQYFFATCTNIVYFSFPSNRYRNEPKSGWSNLPKICLHYLQSLEGDPTTAEPSKFSSRGFEKYVAVLQYFLNRGYNGSSLVYTICITVPPGSGNSLVPPTTLIPVCLAYSRSTGLQKSVVIQLKGRPYLWKGSKLFLIVSVKKGYIGHFAIHNTLNN